MSEMIPERRNNTIDPSPPEGVAIQIRKLTLEYETRSGHLTALADVDLDVRPGEFLCIVGPSGCGKTTMLRILAGLETNYTGKAEFTGKLLNHPANAMVFQERSIFPWMTVEQNVQFGLLSSSLSKAERQRIAQEWIERVGLRDFTRAYPHELSGGMIQRVSIARAFATDPAILLMDEPFAALDEQIKLLMEEELIRIWEGSSKTVVYVTHSVEEAVSLADRIVVMTFRPGRIKAYVEVKFGRPRNVLLLRHEPAFHEMVYHIWEVLREEVDKARAAELEASRKRIG
jgi:NitT/TauT family transport system ATP-binding protein